MPETEPTEVGVAIVECDGCFLVGVRGAHTTLPGLAEFPGGKCHPGETPAACAIRETAEEAGLRVTISEPLYQCRHDYPHGSVNLHFFLCRPESSADRPHDLGGFTWIDARQLSELEFPRANQPVILKLLDRQSRGSSQRGDFG